jgi:myo-inositol-1(or 4)-monophosphatase
VDPIDGTTNFTHTYPASAVAIALMHAQQLLLGITYDPYRDELFTAIKGQGAFLNGQKIQVSEAKTVSECLIATGFAFRRENNEYEQKMHELMRVLKASHDIRRVGSAALDMAYVACGRQEGFYESTLGPWDVAAGEILITEAGGKVSQLGNYTQELNYRNKQQNVLASNGAIHQELFLLLG